ncbi:hypothetical protein [Clostridium arbusti]|uniref:hypothetical protein n=1 Tax=Clostridium arbusti TaxID=1137848 RepID=UPI0013147691|nr:hypothetical protein [Clostridium arbusti]
MKGVDIFMKQININYTDNLISQNGNSILFTTNRPNIVMEQSFRFNSLSILLIK